MASSLYLDDEDVTRAAMRMAISTWAELEMDSQLGKNDNDILQKYILLCPFISSHSSPVVAAALIGLERASKLVRNGGAASLCKNDSSPAVSSPRSREATRAAMRVSIATWSQLQVEGDSNGTSNSSNNDLSSTSTLEKDIEVLKKYVLVCPYVGPNSPASFAVLEELEQLRIRNYSDNSSRNNEEGGPPRLLFHADTDSESATTTFSHNGAGNEKTTATVDADAITPLSKRSNGMVQSPDTPECASPPASPVSSVRRRIFLNDTIKASPTITSTHRKRKSSSSPSWLALLLRFVFFDVTGIMVFATFMSLLWLQRVEQLYWSKQIKALLWEQTRMNDEITYYHRQCDPTDLTTTNPIDLLLSANATTQEAYDHQLLHGFTVFPSVLTDDVSSDLRDFVLSRKNNLTEEESIFIIESDNRFSFGLGTEEPSVAKAVMQMCKKDGKLAQALEQLMGKEPALIEMTAITSSPGAVAQYWHDDVLSVASAIKHARTFGPSYSIFIMLQNTTKDMGATAMCPGSHYCSDGNIEPICERDGFQYTDSRTGNWRAGDALLMNMNSYHRGAAHTDPGSPDRVMMILTFVPKPEPRSESRQMSQGITFSLRWDMWGHTLSDLANADKVMGEPWATLRALGLYKLPGTTWGIDFITSASMRMANEDNGFRRDQLDEHIERGGFPWLPDFLEGQVCPPPCEDESWYEYLNDTIRRCVDFFKQLEIILVFVTLVWFFFAGVILDGENSKSGSHRLRRFGLAIRRLACSHGLVILFFVISNRHVDQSGWAKDITAGRKYTSAFTDEDKFNPPSKKLLGPTTLPHRNDVLLENRYGGRQLKMYNDFINGHPGNSFFLELVDKTVHGRGALESLALFPNETISYLVSEVTSSTSTGTTNGSDRKKGSGRFLLHGPFGSWMWLTDAEARASVRTNLALASSVPMLRELCRELRFISSEYKHGTLRKTALAQIHAVKYAQRLERILWEKAATPIGGKPPLTLFFDDNAYGTLKEGQEYSETSAIATTVQSRASSWATFQLMMETSAPPKLFSNGKVRTQWNKNRSFLSLENKMKAASSSAVEPSRYAWLKEGDVVEGAETNGDGYSFWYKGSVGKISAQGMYFLLYEDGSTGLLRSKYLIRKFYPYYVGEHLEVIDDSSDDDEGEFFKRCKILSIRTEQEGNEEDDGDDDIDEDDDKNIPGKTVTIYDVYLIEEKEVVTGFMDADFRRFHKQMKRRKKRAFKPNNYGPN